VAEALCSVFKQPATIAASAPIDRIDIALIICFLVHKGSGCSSSQALSETNHNQDPASCQERSDWSRAFHSRRAPRDNRKRFIVSADEKLTAFLELESQLGLMRLCSLL
jgi:hypothetical protein